MRKFLAAMIIGTIAGAAAFLVWRNNNFPKPEPLPADTAGGFPESEAELEGWRRFDLREQKEVLITFDRGEFNPQIVIVSQGVKIYWKNMDRNERALSFGGNWRVMKQNEVFSLILNTPGNYIYHGDSEDIKGLIIVK